MSKRHGSPLLTLVLVLCLGVPLAEAAPFSPGSRSLGDPLLPQLGNGGYDARHYSIDLDYDPVANRFDRATTTMKAKATQNLSEFSLDFQDLAVQEVRVNGRSAPFQQVEATPDLSADPTHSQPMKLVITPRDGIRKGKKFRVTVDYSGAEPQVFTDPDSSVEGWVPGCFTPTGGTRTCNSYYVVGEPIGSQAWFPSNNYPTEKASFNTDITVPTGKVAFGVGELKGDAPRNNGDGTSTWRWREDDPTATYLVTASNGDFDYEETTAGGVPFYSAIDSTGTPEQKAAVKTTLARTDEMMDFLADRYGRYPFDSNGALVDRTTGIGYALEVQGKSHYPGNNAGPRLSDSTQLHEISHQWFGNSATLQAWNDIWFNEGWAQWSEWSFSYESGEDPASPADQFQDNYDSATAEDWSMAPTDLDGDPANLFAFFPTYVRGAMTLEGYRQIVGDARFFRLARKIQKRYRFDNVSTQEFIREAVVASGLNSAGRGLLRDYFQQWLYGTQKPTILPADF